MAVEARGELDYEKLAAKLAAKLLQTILKDSTGTELSDFVKNLNVAKISGTSLTARDWSEDLAKLQNFDVALTIQAILKRWGYRVEPTWVYGAEATAPAAGTALASKTVSAGKKGYVFGVFISAQEANDFKLNWTSGATAYSIRVVFASKGSLMSVMPKALNEGLPADAGSTVSITNVNAGSTGIVYQAGLLYLEV